MGVQLVDDVRRRVQAMLEGGVRGEGAHDAAVAGRLDEVRLDAQVPPQTRSLEAHAARLPEHDAGLAPCRGRYVGLGLGLRVGEEEVVRAAEAARLLPFLRGSNRPTSR